MAGKKEVSGRAVGVHGESFSSLGRADVDIDWLNIGTFHKSEADRLPISPPPTLSSGKAAKLHLRGQLGV